METDSKSGNDQKWLTFLREGTIQRHRSCDQLVDLCSGLQQDITTDDLKSEKHQKKTNIKEQNGTPSASQKPAFEPKDPSQLQLQTQLPDELWLAILQATCTFPPEVFGTVMLNLIKNPNFTSSHLFRADIFYDSENDHLFTPDSDTNLSQGFARHMKEEYRPRRAHWPGFRLERTIVRQLIPRNPQLDRPLVQTCHFFRQQDGDAEKNLILYIPHAETPEEVPFYHPTVSQLAFLHTWRPSTASPSNRSPDSPSSPGCLTLLYRSFPSLPISSKLERTALKLLQTIHKHGQGQLIGYEKRVHHDQIIPQKRYQDTYTALKTKYGRQISEKWVEVTDPGKHVFEDIGIAAFLIELWRDMYQLPPGREEVQAQPGAEQDEAAANGKKPPFPGFVDIGCGNGILVHLLLSEGYHGWGFDARERKTWSIFPKEVQQKLHQRILIPRIFEDAFEGRDTEASEQWHDGMFPQGTFIVSNHADELTPWTPLLAYLNNSAFIAIPCCSHDLSGARFRAPATTKAEKREAASRLPQQPDQDATENPMSQVETGSLQRTEAQKKMPSAYASLCSYVSSIATEVNFKTESEVLRIPSTRNSCIIGRSSTESAHPADKAHLVTELVERELKKDITSIARQWIERAEKLMKKPSSGH